MLYPRRHRRLRSIVPQHLFNAVEFKAGFGLLLVRRGLLLLGLLLRRKLLWRIHNEIQAVWWNNWANAFRAR